MAGEILRIGGVTDMSTVDWYGNVSLIVFFAGCNFRCPYCQNSGIIPLDSGKEIPLELLKERIEANRSILDSVVFTGGEPLLQSESVISAAKLSRKLGLKVMLDTNGSKKNNVIKVLNSGFIDRVALDVKAPLEVHDYSVVTGRPDIASESLEGINTCLNLSSDLGIEMEVRTTVVPGLSDDSDFIARIARAISGRSDVYYLQQFDNTGEILSQPLKVERPPSRETMIALAKVAIDEGLQDVFIKTRSDGLERVN